MNNLKQDFKNLWKICFQDTDEFIHFYFEKKFSPENCSFAYEEGKLVSALLMLPYTLSYFGDTLPASYISGACTLPEVRSKGYMKQLLISSLQKINKKRFPVSILIPQEQWLYDYYAKFGYISFFKYTPVHLKKSDIPRYTGLYKTENILPEKLHCISDDLYKWFNKEMHSRNLCVQHSFNDFIAIIEDLYISKGKLIRCYNDCNDTIGLAFTTYNNNSVRIYELLFNSDEAEQALLHATAHQWEYEHITRKTLPHLNNTKSNGMLRITDALQLLKLYASNHPKRSLTFNLFDAIIATNNGYYTINDGICTYSQSHSENAEYTLDIAQLATKIFTPPGYISLMFE